MINKFKYYGFTREEYNACRWNIDKSNSLSMKVLNIFIIFVMTMLIVSSLIYDFVCKYSAYYIEISVISIGILLLVTAVKLSSKDTMMLVYFNIVCVVLFGGLVSLREPDNTSTTFFVILVLIPLLFIANPYIIAGVDVISAILFSIMVYTIKDRTIALYDTYNVVIFTIVSIIAHCFVAKKMLLSINSERKRSELLDAYEKSQEEIRFKAEHDSLSGLYNRGKFIEMMQMRLEKNIDKKSVFGLIDIDDFKEINDTMGHAMGDLLIRKTGESITKSLGNDDICGRIGGDEFVFIIFNRDKINDADKVVLDIVKRIDSCGEENNIRLSASIGLAVIPSDGQEFEEIYKKADAAMYKAKDSGKNQYRYFTSKQ